MNFNLLCLTEPRKLYIIHQITHPIDTSGRRWSADRNLALRRDLSCELIAITNGFPRFAGFVNLPHETDLAAQGNLFSLRSMRRLPGSSTSTTSLLWIFTYPSNGRFTLDTDNGIGRRIFR